MCKSMTEIHNSNLFLPALKKKTKFQGLFLKAWLIAPPQSPDRMFLEESFTLSGKLHISLIFIFSIIFFIM